MPAENNTGALDVGCLRRERQLIPRCQGSDVGLVANHCGNREVALAFLAQFLDCLDGPALLQVRECSHDQFRGLIVGLGIGNEVRQVGQHRALRRLSGQGNDLIHRQVLLFLTHFLLPRDVDASPPIGPDVLGQQLDLTG